MYTSGIVNAGSLALPLPQLGQAPLGEKNICKLIKIYICKLIKQIR